MTFDEIWSDIEKDKIDGAAGIIRRRVLPQACCDLYLGVEKPSNKRVMILRLTDGDVPEAKSIPQARGFETRIAKLADDPTGHSSVIISQSNENFRDIFATLTTDVAGHIATTTNHKAAAEKLLARLKRWQKFLERSGPDGLSGEAQRGLFGELWFVRNYLLPVLGPGSITAWTGPSFAPQDFQFPGVSVEVKVSTAKEHQKLSITGEKQLETSSQLRVILFHLSLNAQKDTGLSLVELISQIRVLLTSSPLALQDFEDALLAAGYFDHHANLYTQPGYLKREQHFFDVKAEFPRIIGSDLRAGVGDVNYSVAVSACLPYVLSETEFLSILQGVSK